MKLTQSRLKELLHYDDATGVFTWLKPTAARCKAGDTAGSISDRGYVLIGVDTRIYRAHRLAWLYQTGAFPKKHIDHIDTVKNNNAWSNLREATDAENKKNTGMQKHNTSGFKGVGWCKAANKWRAYAQLSGNLKHIGLFTTPEAASDAYQSFAKAHHGEFYKEMTYG